MKKPIDLSLILPCYNEQDVFDECVGLIIETLTTSRLSFEIIFVDDGSKDNTRAKIGRVCRKNDFCRALFHTDNTGRGSAVTSGVHASCGTVVGYMDIDCEVSPVYIPSMVGLIQKGKADVVVGKRIYRSSIASFGREVLSVGYRKLSDVVLGTEGIDTESGYKFFDRKKFLPILASIRNTGWFWDTESIVLAHQRGLRIREEPVLFIRRKDKRSSVRLMHDTWEYIKNVWEFYPSTRKPPTFGRG